MLNTYSSPYGCWRTLAVCLGGLVASTCLMLALSQALIGFQVMGLVVASPNTLVTCVS